jgi:hypothetical protein
LVLKVKTTILLQQLRKLRYIRILSYNKKKKRENSLSHPPSFLV